MGPGNVRPLNLMRDYLQMPARLFLMTREFPYGSSESFIADELKFLSTAFEDVWVLPFKGSETKRPVPANVRVLPPIRAASKSCFYLSHIFRPRSLRLFLRELPRQVEREGLSLALITRLAMLSSQREAFENNSSIREVARSPHDLVAYSFWGNPAGYAVPFLSRAGVPCCVRYHGGDLYDRGECLPWRAEVAARSSATVFASDGAQQYFEENVGASPETRARFRVCRLGVEDWGLTPPTTNPNVLVLASCSNIYPLKRVHLIARLAKALSRHQPVEWHHFGPGDDPLLAQELQRTVPNLTVHMHGYVLPPEVLAFYKNNHIDLFVNMSTSEGTPVSIMEALSFGIPVLATDVGGSRESVIDGRSGLLVAADEAENSEAVAARVIAEMQPGGLIARSNPREVWQERHDASKNYTEFANLLLSLVNARGADRGGNEGAAPRD